MTLQVLAGGEFCSRCGGLMQLQLLFAVDLLHSSAEDSAQLFERFVEVSVIGLITPTLVLAITCCFEHERGGYSATVFVLISRGGLQ